MAGGLARVTGLDADAASMLFSALVVAAAATLLFGLAAWVSGSVLAGAVASLWLLSPERMPVVKYAELAHLVAVPLLLLALLAFVARRGIARAAGLGAVWGALGLIHAVAFVASSLLLGLCDLRDLLRACGARARTRSVGHWSGALGSAPLLLGVLALWRRRREGDARFLAFVGLTSLGLTFHHLLTEPALGLNWVPDRFL